MTRTLAAVHSWNIAIGNFFFRYRNALFPVVFLLAATVLRPRLLLGSPGLNRLLIILGVGLAAFGQAFRLMTIGWEYIHRGGKDGKVYAQRLVTKGMYGITRNPMYVGNAMIAIGMTLATCSPTAYGLIIPFFLFVYHAIVSAEEHYLRNKFGAEYEAYRARVNRFIPSVGLIREAFSGMRYNARLALRHDLSTVTGLIIGFIMLPVWRTYFLEGWAAAQIAAVRALGLSCTTGLLYALLLYWKKGTRLFYGAAGYLKGKVLWFRACAQSFVFAGVFLSLFVFPPLPEIEETWLDVLFDLLGASALIVGQLLRIWAVSHSGKTTPSPKIRAAVLITTGPYAYTRNPIYVASFLTGLGMVLVAEALVMLPLFLILFAFLYRATILEEEKFLSATFGLEYERYRRAVPRWIPRFSGIPTKWTLGSNFYLKEWGTGWAVLVAAFILEWTESPLHRQWIANLWYWFAGIAS